MTANAPSTIEVSFAIIGGRQVEDRAATQPLIDLNELELALETVHVSRMMYHHRECWREYKLKQALPDGWRGKTDIRHYERIICNLTRIVPPRKGRGAKVKRQKWLQAAMPDEQQAAVKWLRSLDPEIAASLAQSYRHDDAARKAETRYLKRINRQHRADLANARIK